MTTRLYARIIATLLIWLPIALVHADSIPGAGGGDKIENPLKFKSIQELIKGILDVVVLIGFPILVMVFIWVGFMYVKAQGKPEDIKTANNAFLWTSIGAGVILGAKVISEVLQNTINQISNRA